MSGALYVIGTGPGNPEQMTPEARAAVDASTLFFGYAPYLDRLDLRPGQERHASDNREELARARAALDAALEGKTVCMVSGGDPGVFAMAAAVCEAIDADTARFGGVPLTIVPGISAMMAAAARLGAPLGNDFCAISLSDNLKPWNVIETRLRAAAGAGFAMAFYNPVSKARPWQLGKTFNILRETLPNSIPVVFARAVGRPDETIRTVPLSDAQPEMADMATCILIGNGYTRVIARDGQPDLVYTPRFVPEAGNG
ncbi:precorrin-3B C(17)-methyltransferase [Pelagibacterium xiamenense]|uniref:precorrin-3B C(17)-methyltransferase n=1 Tax=Pelagibacterium xiamenense TaxID=2901140 RepID=UPI001E57D49E|nr:precorrin-3B C(17)-methyltransferase [Pelagibacterium xiamenense]MCD7059635.1 precorrin-3B C(17)-methyltransferase [Pelagibacterium xiamenense]